MAVLEVKKFAKWHILLALAFNIVGISIIKSLVIDHTYYMSQNQTSPFTVYQRVSSIYYDINYKQLLVT